MMTNTAVVSARHLTKSFNGQLAVDAIDFDVTQGECVGLLGPNGAGKTTILLMLLGQVIPTAGELCILGQRLPQQACQLRKRVGVVPQLDNLDPDFSVVENLRTYARYFGLRGPRVTARIQALLAFAALEHKAQARVPELSGGMKRRLTLARALINEPELLILDEPTTGLDPQARQLIWARLRELRNQGTTLILTTHYLEEAERLCNRILLIDHGKILEKGTPRELIQRHIEPQVIEVHGENVALLYEQRDSLPVTRMEMIGETLLCYCEDERDLLAQLMTWPQLEFVHRRANLEDVFLKLTGRELRDG